MSDLIEIAEDTVRLAWLVLLFWLFGYWDLVKNRGDGGRSGKKFYRKRESNGRR